ncbi:serine/threonine-protein kinase [Allokutzneria albata]|uniref:non-specific serine/threonine protein kinase n=1 Tax=Allokutzneria albata TaxID=211114 RepID=A0A1G9VKG4_ALLAB|nr:serine/threonine-protein kinase [Allokutzneria albata]SDM72712.1 serine/threonine protein kinase [Allokutzneria albata]
MTAPLSMIRALPQYAVGDRIGSGGMGEVFAGVHRSLGRQVAIKQLPQEINDRAGASMRFDREARVLASLDHPHIVPVYDYVQNLLVMEKLDGGTVFDRMRPGGVTGEQACAITLAMLSGLHAAHVAGVLHLDVKPKNLLFTTGGVVKVADFGIAQVIGEGATLVTHGGEVLGTPAYIAPEQAMGNALTPAADVYSAATVLYELLTGDLPFERDCGALTMMRRHIFADPQWIQGVPEPLASVVMRGLARELPGRYREAESFATDLAAAATTVYGRGWLERSGIPVLHLAPRVVASLSSGSGRTKSATVALPGVREETTLVAPGRRRAEPRSLVPALLAVVALVASVVGALIAPARLAHPGQADVSVNGARSDQVVTVDLSKSITVAGAGPISGPVRVGLFGATVPLASGTSRPVTPNKNGAFATEVEMPALARWIVGGAVTGEVRWERPGQQDAVQTFTVFTKQYPLASAMGAGSLVLGLFALAYVESTVRTLRRGYRRPSARYTALPLGALFGLALWTFVSVMTQHELALGYGLVCALAGAVAASCFVVATERSSHTARRTT